ncbi:MAG: polysaccharide biosynthesis tyrosine autokinase [Solirubrobacteraceae bacterium]
MDSKQQLRLLWSSRWWLAGLALIAAVAAYVASSSRTDVYRGSALAQVIPSQQADGPALGTDQLLQATNFYAELAQTTRILDAAQKEGGFRESLDGRVEVTPEPDLLVLEFSGESPEPATAAAYANAYAQAFAAEVANLEDAERRRLLAGPQRRVTEIRRQLRRSPAGSAEAAALEAELQALQGRLADVALSPTDNVRIIQPAIAPREPVSPKPLRDAILALVVALVLCSSAALLRLALTDRYHSAEEAALDLRLPVLAELPKSASGEPKALEAFRKLRAQVEFTLSAQPVSEPSGRGHQTHARRNVLLVTSPEAASGKTYVTSNLSRALAADGRRVMAVDGDLRRPTLHDAFGLQQAPGLGELLTSGRAEDLDLSRHAVALPDAVRRRGGVLAAVPAGRLAEDTAERLSSATMAGAMAELSHDNDIVLVDSPPVLAIVDAVVLTRYTDGVIVVVDARRSRRRNIRRAVETLRAVQAPILGLVFNRSRVSASDYGYYGSLPTGVRREAELTR